MNTTDQMKV